MVSHAARRVGVLKNGSPSNASARYQLMLMHLFYLIAGWRSQYRCPPANSPLSFRFGGPPSLSTLPVN